MPVEGAQYPVNLILGGKRCLVVGGGPIAARKVAGLLACAAQVHVIAAEPGPELAALTARGSGDHGGGSGRHRSGGGATGQGAGSHGSGGRATGQGAGSHDGTAGAPGPGVTVEARPYRPGDLAGYHLVIAATNDAALNRAIFVEAEAAGTWVNSADDPASCTFTLPSIIRRGPIMVTVSTGGRSPALARWLKDRIEGNLGPEYEVLVELLASAREDMRAAGRSTEEADWKSVLDSDMLDLIKAGQVSVARERLESWLSSSSD